MADLQIGTRAGFAAVGPSSGGLIADILADGSNTFTTLSSSAFYPGQRVIFRVKSTGAVFGSTVRVITAVNVATGVCTYDGADLTLVAGTHGVYSAEPGLVTTLQGDFRSNQNGGYSSEEGAFLPTLATIAGIKGLLSGAVPGYYTAARMNQMTENDLIYAFRQQFMPASIK